MTVGMALSTSAHAVHLDPPPPPSADVKYRVGAEERTVRWNNEAGLTPFTRISVFDADAVQLRVDAGSGSPLRHLLDPLADHGDGHARHDYGSPMATIVLRVRLTGGELIDLKYEDPGLAEEEQLIDQAVSILREESGALRCRHGDRLLVLYGRGVATIEVSPRGAVL